MKDMQRSLARERLYYENSAKFRLDCLSKAVLRNCLKGTQSNTLFETWFGYSLQEFKDHIEKQFHPYMNWNNYGQWHIDHKEPKAKFNYETIGCEEFKKCWSLDNLQPLWKQDNLKKVSNGFKIKH